MKLRDILNWVKKASKKNHEPLRQIDKEDQYATIKHKTKTLGMRRMSIHNNRKNTRGRRIQYVRIGRYTKPIYHSAS